MVFKMANDGQAGAGIEHPELMNKQEIITRFITA
jgi:hypothetical protein